MRLGERFDAGPAAASGSSQASAPRRACAPPPRQRRGGPNRPTCPRATQLGRPAVSHAFFAAAGTVPRALLAASGSADCTDWGGRAAAGWEAAGLRKKDCNEIPTFGVAPVVELMSAAAAGDGAAGEHAGGENALLENLGRILPDAGLRIEPLRLPIRSIVFI